MKKHQLLALFLGALLASLWACKPTNKKESSKSTKTMNVDSQTKEVDLQKIDPKKIGQKNKNTVKKFFELLEQENITAFVDLFAHNGKQVNPYASGLFPTGAKGKAALKKYWEPVPGNFAGMKFPIHEIYAMEDPNIVYVKYSGQIKLKDNAGTYENDYYSTFKFDSNGKIVEYVEIFNPIVAARGFGLLDKIK